MGSGTVVVGAFPTAFSISWPSFTLFRLKVKSNKISSDIHDPSRVVIEVYKQRRIHRDTSVGTIEEGIEVLLTESLAGSEHVLLKYSNGQFLTFVS